MKRNIKFFAIVISLLMISFLVLIGGMYMIGNNYERTNIDKQSTNLSSSMKEEDIILEDAPLAQVEMKSKFRSYLHEEGKVLTLFTEEQYTELKSVREKGERDPLSYDEILFLVNDSIRLYFEYDEIHLTNANKDYILPLGLSLVQSSNACILYPYHGNYSECTSYSEAEQVYGKMLEEIYAIIYYRIYMHDAGFELVHHSYKSEVGDMVFGNNVDKECGYISSAVPIAVKQMLILDDSVIGGVENEQKLINEYKKMLEWSKYMDASLNVVYDWYEPPVLDAPILWTNIVNTWKEPILYQFWITGLAIEKMQQIYPTEELTEMMPRQESCYIAQEMRDSLQPIIHFDSDTGRFSMTADMSISFSIIGKYDEQDGVLKLYPENVAEGTGTYWYVLYEENDTYIYSKENSNPIPYDEYMWPEGLIFEKLYDSWKK